MAKESQDQVFHYFRKVTSGLVPDPITISMEFPSGFRAVRLEANRVPMRQTFHVRIALTDQTKEVARAQGLEHQIRMLAAVVEHSDSIVVVKDLNCRVIATNTAFARAAGYEKPSELIGKTDAEIFGVSPDTEPICSYMEDERKAMTLSPGDMLISEEPVVTPSGEVRTVLTKKFPVRPFLLEKEIQSAVSVLYPLVEQKGNQLQLNLDKNLPRRVVGDPDRLRQIILNLAGNAVKFTKKGMVNVTLRSLENKEETHTLQLQVQYTGPGMTRESLNRLFQPFYQVDDASRPHPGGTGLGMTITRELVQKMGGSIQVESVLGEGTKAVVHLPLKESI